MHLAAEQEKHAQWVYPSQISLAVQGRFGAVRAGRLRWDICVNFNFITMLHFDRPDLLKECPHHPHNRTCGLCEHRQPDLDCHCDMCLSLDTRTYWWVDAGERRGRGRKLNIIGRKWAEKLKKKDMGLGNCSMYWRSYCRIIIKLWSDPLECSSRRYVSIKMGRPTPYFWTESSTTKEWAFVSLLFWELRRKNWPTLRSRKF